MSEMNPIECFNRLSPIPMKWPIELGDGRVLLIIDWHPNGSLDDIEIDSCESLEVIIRGRISLAKEEKRDLKGVE